MDDVTALRFSAGGGKGEVAQFQDDGDAVAADARRAEAMGYAVLVYPDHVINPLGMIPVLTWAAAACSLAYYWTKYPPPATHLAPTTS